MKVFHKVLASGLLLAALPLAGASAVTVSKDPLPRVEDKLCPGVVGMETESALTVLDRVRYNAVRLGIPLDTPGACKPNLMIAFVSDPNESLNRLMDEKPRLFEEASLTEKRRLRAERGPAQSWNVVRTKTRDGMPVTRRIGSTDVPEARMWSAHSKIYTATRADIVYSVVLFDSKEVEKATLKQLADYVSMRAFANDYTSFEGASDNSILTLFNQNGARPSELTDADLHFLGSLYSGEANIPGMTKEREIENKAGA